MNRTRSPGTQKRGLVGIGWVKKGVQGVINVTLVMPIWIPTVIDVSIVLLLGIPDVIVIWKLQGLTLSLIPPKRGLPRCPNQVGKGPLKNLGRVSWKNYWGCCRCREVSWFRNRLQDWAGNWERGRRHPWKGHWAFEWSRYSLENLQTGCHSCQNQKGEWSWWTHRSHGWWGNKRFEKGNPSRTGWCWLSCGGFSTWVGWTETTCFDGDHSHRTCGWTHCAIKGIDRPWFCHQVEYPWLWN